MQNFIAAVRLARQDFFKLKRRHAAPEWALWVMTGLVAAGLGWCALAGASPGGQRRRLTVTWPGLAGWPWPLLLTSLIIGVV